VCRESGTKPQYSRTLPLAFPEVFGVGQFRGALERAACNFISSCARIFRATLLQAAMVARFFSPIFHLSPSSGILNRIELQTRIAPPHWPISRKMTSINDQRSQNRREFLRCTAFSFSFAALGLTAFFKTRAAESSNKDTRKTLVGSNVYGWGQYAQRDHKSLDIEEVLSALRDTGYDYLESYLNVARPDENGRFAEQLKAKGLQPVSLYVGATLHEADKASGVVKDILAASKVAREAGFRVLSCNADPIGREKTDEELKTQCAALTDLGEGLKALGMNLGVHHHMPEMANHAREFHFNFRHTKPEVVGWCYDVHWVWKGGLMPLEALKEYGDRVVTWHLRQSRKGIWWEDLDSGDIDYQVVAQYANEHHLARRFSVELALEPGTKITRSVVENHRRSRQFVRRVFEA
jgi:inosose dehydratase